MKKSLVIAAVGLTLVVASGCGKYSASCKKSEDLTAPWSGLGLPVDDGRVCESSTKEAKIQFISKDKDKWRGQFEEKFLSNGYTKKECKSDYCIYEKGEKGKDSRVQVGVYGETKWVTVTLRESR